MSASILYEFETSLFINKIVMYQHLPTILLKQILKLKFSHKCIEYNEHNKFVFKIDVNRLIIN